MELLRNTPDKFYSLAVVDPPYFSGPERRRYYGSEQSTQGIERRYYPELSTWITPNSDYFSELFRVSENQIIWGINYFDYRFPSPGRIVWDKCNGKTSFSDCEIAYCSLHDSVRIFRYMWNGMMQGKSIDEGHIMQGNKQLNEVRIHPTQKPVALYEWILQRYGKHIHGKLLDTHVGSGSSLIAYEKHGYEYDATELDENMYRLSEIRLSAYRNNNFGQPKREDLLLLTKNEIQHSTSILI
ncbi:MAG: DNA methyltransferase [Oscillospiraceae bacterium]